MNILRMCLNWKVLAAVLAVGVGLFVYAPSLAAVSLPFLILAICPLSMVFMMAAMNGMGSDSKPQGDGGASGPKHQEGRVEQLAQLRAQQQDLSDKISALERQ